MPTPSSSLASRTKVTSGSLSASRIRCTSHVSGSADTRRTPLALSASNTTWELTADTGMGRDVIAPRSLAQERVRGAAKGEHGNIRRTVDPNWHVHRADAAADE